MYDDVLIPTDGSDAAAAAVDHGVDLATELGATVHALSVVDVPAYAVLPEAEWLTVEGTLEEICREAVATVESKATAAGVDATTAIRRGKPHEEILAHADERDVDAVVMGTHGRSGLDRMVLGSVSSKVVRNADVPVVLRRVESESG